MNRFGQDKVSALCDCWLRTQSTIEGAQLRNCVFWELDVQEGYLLNTEMVMETFYGALTRPKYVLINLTTMLIDHFCNPLQIMHSS